ncbi:MAG: hypothetical protein AAFP92_28790, partial [Bacteroidota bacterium]
LIRAFVALKISHELSNEGRMLFRDDCGGCTTFSTVSEKIRPKAASDWSLIRAFVALNKSHELSN